MLIIYLLTRPYHETNKDDYSFIKRKVLVLDAWHENQEASYKAVMKLLNDHKVVIDRIQKNMSDYEKSAEQIHKDYVMVNCHIAAVERRYADLVPVHRHYHLSDESIKIKRVTNECHGRTEEKVYRAGEKLAAGDPVKTETDNQAQANVGIRGQDADPIPSYRAPDPGTFGVNRGSEDALKRR